MGHSSLVVSESLRRVYTPCVRLLVTSDLHYDLRGHLTERATIEAMIDRMIDERADAVVLAGDNAHGLDAFAGCVALFRRLGCPVYVLAGNHDVWKDKVRGITSEVLWTRELAAATAAAGATWLETTTARFGNVGLAGSLAWYDYSAIDRGVSATKTEIADLKSHFNNDANWIDWPRTDIAFANELSDGLVQRVRSLADDAAIAHIVVVTHVPIFEEQMHRKPHDRGWGFANAYYGNLTLGERLKHEPKLRAVVSGHTHWGIDETVQRNGLTPLAVRVVGSDYKIPNFTRIDL